MTGMMRAATGMRAAAGAAALLACAAIAQPARADLYLNTAYIPFADTVGITIKQLGSSSDTVYNNIGVGMFSITANTTSASSPATSSFNAFCIDLFGDLNGSFTYLKNATTPTFVPANAGPAAPGAYNPFPLSTDLNGNALSATQIKQMTALANYGFEQAGAWSSLPSNQPTAYIDSAALQLAIWSIEYENPANDFSINYSESNAGGAALQGQVAYYINVLLPTLGVGNNVSGIGTSNNATSQALLISVPEPTSIAMLIIGLAGLAAVRARKQGEGALPPSTPH